MLIAVSFLSSEVTSGIFHAADGAAVHRTTAGVRLRVGWQQLQLVEQQLVVLLLSLETTAWLLGHVVAAVTGTGEG